MESPDRTQGKIKQRILVAAAGLFGRRGYNGVSTRQIAVTAGVNEVTIYRHYPRKRDLYLAILAEELSHVYLRGDQLTDIAEARDARQAVTRTFSLIETALLERPSVLPLALYGSLEAAGDVDALLRKHLGEFVEIIARYLEPWVKEGIKGGAPLVRSAHGLVMALISIAVFRQPLRRVFPAGAAHADATASFVDLFTDFAGQQADEAGSTVVGSMAASSASTS